MMYSTPEASKDSSQLRIVTEQIVLPDEVQVDLDEERKQIDEQKVTEDYWAGRNLAGRNSAQWAA